MDILRSGDGNIVENRDRGSDTCSPMHAVTELDIPGCDALADLVLRYLIRAPLEIYVKPGHQYGCG